MQKTMRSAAVGAIPAEDRYHGRGGTAGDWATPEHLELFIRQFVIDRVQGTPASPVLATGCKSNDVGGATAKEADQQPCQPEESRPGSTIGRSSPQAHHDHLMNRPTSSDPLDKRESEHEPPRAPRPSQDGWSGPQVRFVGVERVQDDGGCNWFRCISCLCPDIGWHAPAPLHRTQPVYQENIAPNLTSSDGAGAAH